MNSNFIKRTITGLLFVILLVGSILYGPLSFITAFGLFSALSTYELTGLLNQTEKVNVNRFITSLSSLYLFIATALYQAEIVHSGFIYIPYLAILLYLIISELYFDKKNPIGNIAATALSQIYVGLNFALINLLAFDTTAYNPSLTTYRSIIPLSLFIFIWISDSGAYLVGSAIGKHKLFPRISPNKSWEGSIGGGLFAVLAALLLTYLDHTYLDSTFTLIQWIGFALVVVVFGTWGDLTESLFKRQLGIKDSGNVLPGHGGFLDRFDSTILAIPATVIYLFLFL